MEVEQPSIVQLEKQLTTSHNSEDDDSVEQHNSVNGENNTTATVPLDLASTDKHPLQNRWTMWYDNPGKKTSQTNWANYLRKIATIDSVEDFWGLYNNVVPASKLNPGTNYHLFKENVEPKWEDPENKKGGKWVINVPKQAQGKKDNLDKLWLWLLLAVIGEAFVDEGEVCGCVVSIRKPQDKLALWTKDATNEGATRRVGAQLKELLELPNTASIGYQSHDDCMMKNSSFNNRSKYEV